MSDIPRTDTSIYFTENSQMYDIASEMKKLERELYAANERIKLLEAANSDVHRIANERNAANERIKELEAVVNDPNALWTNWLRGTVSLPSGIGDVRQYQEYIKLLDDALDCVVVSCSHLNHKKKHQHKYNEPCPVEQLIRKAMEAKP